MTTAHAAARIARAQEQFHRSPALGARVRSELERLAGKSPVGSASIIEPCACAIQATLVSHSTTSPDEAFRQAQRAEAHRDAAPRSPTRTRRRKVRIKDDDRPWAECSEFSGEFTWVPANAEPTNENWVEFVGDVEPL
jgi:hypothetical protein